MSRRQFSEIPVSLQDWYNDLVDLIHCLIETTLLKQANMSNTFTEQQVKPTQLLPVTINVNYNNIHF